MLTFKVCELDGYIFLNHRACILTGEPGCPADMREDAFSATDGLWLLPAWPNSSHFHSDSYGIHTQLIWIKH